VGIKQVKLAVNELTIGMYISGLDRPWTQTPFPLQGFYIRDIDELKKLKSLCSFVYIDVVKGRSPVGTKLRSYSGGAAAGGATSHDGPKRNVALAPVTVPVKPIKIRRDQHQDIKPLKREVKKARALHQKVYNAVGDVLSQLDSEKFYDIPVAETRRLASDMVDSVLRNPDAFTWLSRVQEKDEYTYSHALRSSVWAILFGRHIGLDKRELDILAMGVLLKDVGKTKLPHELIVKAQRTEREQEKYESFVMLGVELLKNADGMEPRVISVVRTHCERLNGSGFPQHLVGDKIPLLGKIAGIVTFYDTIITPRDATVPIAPSKAVAKLYELRNVQFQEDLVVEFIRAIGLYPTGTLVELNNGEVGVVVEQNFERRLKPKVMLVMDALKQPLKTKRLLDLAADDRTKQALIDAGKATLAEVQKIEIARDLEPGSYDVDILAIRDEYLLSSEKKGLRALLGRFTR
jgi:HD-GYP domain-containing protein (c-di-GMP phosphodiesterase class II)